MWPVRLPRLRWQRVCSPGVYGMREGMDCGHGSGNGPAGAYLTEEVGFAGQSPKATVDPWPTVIASALILWQWVHWRRGPHVSTLARRHPIVTLLVDGYFLIHFFYRRRGHEPEADLCREGHLPQG